MEWQPIDTAPSGEIVLVAWAGSRVQLAKFTTGWGWCETFPVDGYRQGIYAPTHWMPLPTPPTEAQ